MVGRRDRGVESRHLGGLPHARCSSIPPRSRGEGEAPLLYGCLLLSNAGSLFLPGSNLTNLIVLGHLHLSGGQFLAHMWAAALALSLVVTAIVVAAFEHRCAADPGRGTQPRRSRPALGLGLVAVLAATVLVVVLHNAAIPVAAVGLAAVGVRILATGKEDVRHAADVLGVPVLVGLFGVAVTLGTLGRVWSGPADALVAPRQLGYSGGRSRLLGAGQQPARRLAPRSSPAPTTLSRC